MTDTLRAVMAKMTDDGPKTAFADIPESDLPDEDVLIDVACSTLNYKDGLSLKYPKMICRSFPMVIGIDLAGTVVEDRSGTYAPGEKVLVTGWGLAESHWGGYIPRQRVKPEFLTRVPDSMSLSQSMAIGTAGYTAMLCVLELEKNGVTPADGPVIVTGAAGGVGSVAVAVLAKLGYEVHASTGRVAEQGDYLKKLGAAELVDRATLSIDAPPVDREVYAGAVDAVGGKTLATLLSRTKAWGTVTCCGLAESADLPASVMPLILRGVRLIGVNSVFMKNPTRQEAWDRLATDLDMGLLADMTTTEPLSNIFDLGEKILKGQIRGRTVIDVNA